MLKLQSSLVQHLNSRMRNSMLILQIWKYCSTTSSSLSSVPKWCSCYRETGRFLSSGLCKLFSLNLLHKNLMEISNCVAYSTSSCLSASGELSSIRKSFELHQNAISDERWIRDSFVLESFAVQYMEIWMLGIILCKKQQSHYVTGAQTKNKIIAKLDKNNKNDTITSNAWGMHD